MSRRNGMANRVKVFYRNDGAFDEDDLVFNRATNKYECMSEVRTFDDTIIKVGKTTVIRRRGK